MQIKVVLSGLPSVVVEERDEAYQRAVNRAIKGAAVAVRRNVHQWDAAPSAPPLGRALAAASLAIWLGVIVTGRMIGFTTTRASLAEPAPVEDLEELLGLPGDGGGTSGPQPAEK